jgi:polyhydroxyalkanoate synthesis regulator phasin
VLCTAGSIACYTTGRLGKLSDQIKALRRSIDKKIAKLQEMQENKAKWQHMQLVREEIWNLKRSLANLEGKKK